MTPMAKQLPLVLLIEDDANDVLLFRRALKKLAIDAQLEVAENCEQAQAFLSGISPRPDGGGHLLPALVLLDLKLPGETGLELLSWLRKEPSLRALIVVVFTSSREASDVREAYALGANSFIVKPIGFEPLLDTLNSIFRYWLQLNERPELYGREASRPVGNRH